MYSISKSTLSLLYIEKAEFSVNSTRDSELRLESWVKSSEIWKEVCFLILVLPRQFSFILGFGLVYVFQRVVKLFCLLKQKRLNDHKGDSVFFLQN